MVKPSRKDWAWVFAISSVLILMAYLHGPPVPQKTGPPVEFRTIHDQTRTMTDAQWQAYCRQMSGYGLTGSGWVGEVRKHGAFYSAHIGVTPPFPGIPFLQGVVINDIPQNIALKMNKGEKVQYSGNITKIEKKLGAYLVVSINNADINRIEN